MGASIRSRPRAREPARLDERRFARFSAIVTSELGIRMPECKRSMLESRLQRRMHQLGLVSMEAYEHYLFDSPHSADEIVHFLDLVTTNKTDFFREPNHFSHLTQNLLPALARERGSYAFKFHLWCAGCSTGQEAYTLAMVLSEFRVTHPGFSFELVATDISTRVLAHARSAIYPEEVIEPIPKMLRHKYLLRSKSRNQPLVRMAPELRDAVRFGRLNFMAKSYGVRANLDVIFFRNVMIYFDKPTQQAVLGRLCGHLARGGHLFISHSESLTGLELPLEMVASSVFQRTR